MSACLEIDRFENKLAQTADEFGKKEKLKKKKARNAKGNYGC